MPTFEIKIWVNGEYQGRAQLGTVEIDETVRTNPIITFPFHEGVHIVEASVDSENSVSEINESNNDYVAIMSVIPEFYVATLIMAFLLATLVAVSFRARLFRN